MDECKGCVSYESTDICEHIDFCMHCKRAYYEPFERSIHADLYTKKEKEENEPN